MYKCHQIWPFNATRRNVDGMSRTCEVCLTKGSQSKSKVRRLLIAERIIALCEEHAETAQKSDAQTVDELHELYTEVSGRRSLLPRRSPLNRRVFPARPEGRRRNDGRRAEDH